MMDEDWARWQWAKARDIKPVSRRRQRVVRRFGCESVRTCASAVLHADPGQRVGEHAVLALAGGSPARCLGRAVR
eukprot:5446726-Pyramimonas_sp.AAC.1